jgi:dolichyl-phosphate-mannose--protein O-mannosyl transferase
MISLTKFIFLGIAALQLFQISSSFLINVSTKTKSNSFGRVLSTSKISYLTNTKLHIQPATDGETNSLIAEPNAKPQGYMSSDLSSNEDGKQGRVFAYILFALVPVLFLVPFFLSRGFEPPVDPDMAPTTSISTRTTQK